MGQVITNLKAKFGVESSDFKKGLSDNEKDLLKFDKKVSDSVTNLGKFFSPLALLGGAAGAIALFKQSIESVEGPADRFEAVIGGGKEALFEFQRALGGTDFTDFFNNLQEGFERGKAFTEALDELADRTAYNDYKIAELNRNSEALQEIVKDKTKELKVRADAAEQVKAIEEAIVKRKLELAQEEFEIIKGQWEARNKMEAEEAIKVYEIVDNMGPELRARLQTAFEGATESQMGSVKRGVQSVLKGLWDKDLIKEIDPEVLESYGEYFKLIETGEKDVLIKLFETFKSIDEKGYQAQKEYNGIVAMTTKLLAAENKELKKKKELVEEIQRAEGISPVTTENLSLPVFSTPAPTDNIQEYTGQLANLTDGWDTMVKTYKGVSDEMVAINSIINETIENAISGFGEWLGEYAVGVSGFDELGSMLGSAFGDMLIQLGKVAIKTGIGIAAIQAAFSSLNPAIAIGAGVALIAFGAAIKGSIQAIGESNSQTSSVTAGSTSGSFTYDNRINEPIIIKIQGELTADGPSLKYVIDQEMSRRAIVTGG